MLWRFKFWTLTNYMSYKFWGPKLADREMNVPWRFFGWEKMGALFFNGWKMIWVQKNCREIFTLKIGGLNLGPNRKYLYIAQVNRKLLGRRRGFQMEFSRSAVKLFTVNTSVKRLGKGRLSPLEGDLFHPTYYLPIFVRPCMGFISLNLLYNL